MITFKKLRYQNILSTGNIFTEIDLNRSQSTLIVGKNGAGKSTMIDAISFGLYGTPFRDINKPILLNSITGKGLLVEIEFSIGSKEYMIRRGMKPNIFEIYMDGVLLDQDADARKYQERLEKQILKMNHKTFSQIVVLGSRNFVPFMKLPAQLRRNIVENLLDIQVFSTMNTLLKEKVSANKESLTAIDAQIGAARASIEVHEQYKNRGVGPNSAIETLEREAESKKNRLYDLVAESDRITAELKKVMASIDESDVNKTLRTKAKALELQNQLLFKKEQLEEDIGFFHDNDTCPTCRQDIDASYKAGIVTAKKKRASGLIESLNELEEKIKNIDAVIDATEEIRSNIRNLTADLNTNNSIIKMEKRNLLELQTRIAEAKADSEKSTIESGDVIKDLQATIAQLNLTKEELLKEKALLDASGGLLKDSGIKTHIVKQYIPLMNQYINSYLAAMDFFVNFELDENFNETIRSRFRDTFVYNSFSEGEKLKIDLALMFAWREISMARNSTATNLLIMDEILDSSLDNEGTDYFFKILKILVEKTNVFLISHKGDGLYDKFHSVIKFEKRGNFSHIAR